MVVPNTISLVLATMVALAAIYSCQAEVFSALVDLQRVLYAENDIAQKLRIYINQEESRIAYLKSLADSYEAHSAEALQDTESHLANPVNSFLLVKRFTSDWDKVEQTLRTNYGDEFLQSISRTLEDFPDQEDLTGAASALIRLQDTYALETKKLARGEIQGIQYSPILSADDCFDLGRISYNQQDYYHTVLWMQQALSQWNEEHTKTIDKATLLDYLSFSASMQGNTRAALNYTIEWLTLEPGHQRALNNKKYYEQVLEEAEAERRKGDEGDLPVQEEEFKNERILDDYRSSMEFATYEALCRNEITRHDPTAHLLTCQYKRHHPLYYIRPLKEETMYLKPWIVIYHDILTDTEIAKVKELATPRLKRATVQNPQTGQLETAYYRVSKSAWLRDEEDPLILAVSNKVNAASNLTLDTAEELQVVNYGIGGHYEPHFDFARKEEKAAFDPDSGNRIATAIFYMSDVAAGGATVFPNIGVKLWPEKGAMAFWYNLLASGEGDYETRHAACPVLTGSKWVCNKWIHERGQEFKRPCNIDPFV